AADRGGDWDLDWVHGTITADALRFDSYRGVMAAPTIVSGVAYAGENTIVLTFDQALDAASQPTLSYFASDMLTPSSVEINGAATNLSAAVISGNTLTLTLPMETFTNGDVLTIKYEDPTGNQTSGVLQASLSGDDVATFQNDVTVYGARPTTAPTLTATGGT
ncbi:SwmB domain-containing protein, partial [Azospirillum brasilense]